MTANNMADEWEIYFDKVTNFDSPGYEDTEISLLLTKAEERFFFQNYTGSNKLREGFEETEKRRKDLSELISNANVTVSSTDQTGILPNGTFYDLPTNFLYSIKEEVTIASDDACANGNRIKVKPITHDEYTVNLENPFKQPYDELVWRLDYSRETTITAKRHELITDGSYTVSAYHLRYLKRLPGITVNRTTTTNQVNSLLDESTHRRIIDMAVEIALEITVDNRLQTNLLLNQTNE
jgi:hypothetical protein